MVNETMIDKIETARLAEIEAWAVLVDARGEHRRIAAVVDAAQTAWWKAQEKTRDLDAILYGTPQTR